MNSYNYLIRFSLKSPIQFIQLSNRASSKPPGLHVDDLAVCQPQVRMLEKPAQELEPLQSADQV